MPIMIEEEENAEDDVFESQEQPRPRIPSHASHSMPQTETALHDEVLPRIDVADVKVSARERAQLSSLDDVTSMKARGTLNVDEGSSKLLPPAGRCSTAVVSQETLFLDRTAPFTHGRQLEGLHLEEAVLQRGRGGRKRGKGQRGGPRRVRRRKGRGAGYPLTS